MKKKEHFASSFARQMCADLGFRGGESLPEIHEHFAGIYAGEYLQSAVVGIAAVLGWMETRQIYRFSRSLVEGFAGSPRMGFRLRDLHLPFLSLYLDVSAADVRVDGNRLLGAYVLVCMPPETCICVDVVVREDCGEYRMLRFSVPYFMDRPVQEAVDMVAGNCAGGRDAVCLILELLSYISSDCPDVRDMGRKVVLASGKKGKPVPVSYREWEAGYRYVDECGAAEGTICRGGTHAPPRAHVRRGHWHTYHYGPGRSLTRVRWVADMRVGKGELGDVVRRKTDE